MLFRDATTVVVDKPSGVLVHNSPFTRTRERTLVAHVRETYDSDFSPVHRLDRATSGVILFARGAEAISAWQCALEHADKRYLALVRGEVREVIPVDHPLRDENGRSQSAQSVIAPVWWQAVPRCSLVRVRVFTGRTHQVRRHCHHVSHPVLGDANYGKGPLNRDYRARYGLNRLALHAERLSVVHPLSGEPLEWHAELPQDLLVPIEKIRNFRVDGPET